MADWTVGADRDLRIIERDSWDGQAAQDNIFAWAGWDDDDPDPSMARRCFLVYDAEEPELKGSYKLPFADIVSGEPVAVDAGLQAAASRLPQTDIPADVADRARAVLDAYFERMDEDSGEQSHAPQMRTFPARVIQRAAPADLRQILTETYDFDADVDPYFFGAEISNDRLDAYFTHMDRDTTLRNFRDDAQAGVSFLDSHDTWKLGMGQTLDATLEDDGEVARVLADIYTVYGIRFGGQHSFASTDDFIMAVRTGIVRDVSVGFYGGDEICDVCGDPVWGWTDCPHLPGMEYPIGDRGEETVLATATIIDARLAEVSAVYDGATPEAMIEKATRLLAAGELSARQALQLERRYRMRLPDLPALQQAGRERLWRGWQAQKQGRLSAGQRGTNLAAFLNDRIDEMTDDDVPRSDVVADMADAAGIESGTVNQILNGDIDCPPQERLEAFAEVLGVDADAVISAAAEDGCEYERSRGTKERVNMDAEKVLEGVRVALSEIAPPAEIREKPANEIVNWLVGEYSRLVDLEAEAERLRPLADVGRQYRTDLIDEALAEGVRAYGNEFAQERYRELLESDATSLDMIKQMRDDWAAQASQRLPGGRLTQDDDDEVPAGNGVERNVPDAAYASG